MLYYKVARNMLNFNLYMNISTQKICLLDRATSSLSLTYVPTYFWVALKNSREHQRRASSWTFSVPCEQLPVQDTQWFYHFVKQGICSDKVAATGKEWNPKIPLFFFLCNVHCSPSSGREWLMVQLWATPVQLQPWQGLPSAQPF